MKFARFPDSFGYTSTIDILHLLMDWMIASISKHVESATTSVITLYSHVVLFITDHINRSSIIMLIMSHDLTHLDNPTTSTNRL